MGLAIVAIPEEQDRVWKISSEKVPHLTLLFLGDAESADTQQIVQFVQHAVTLSEHGPFYLDVDRRGELGEDQADVLFFSKRSWNLKWIKQFRGQLLQNDAIRTAYDSTEQFGAPQEWIPHLTLGYPETPANKLDDERDDYPIYSVEFDRIAVWEGNFEGPEFRLEWPDRPEELEGPLAVAWADEQKKALRHQAAAQPTGDSVEDKDIEEETEGSMLHTAAKGADFVGFLVHGIPEDGEAFILEHYGVKGMKWGHRSGSGSGSSPTPVAPTATSRVPQGNRRKTKIEAKGGENHPAHQDAIKVAEAKTKLKKSGPAALSNQELQQLQTRLNLERNVDTLIGNQTRIARGRNFIKRRTGELQEVNTSVNTGLNSARLADQLRGK